MRMNICREFKVMELRLSCKFACLNQKSPRSAIGNHSLEAGFETASSSKNDYGTDFTGWFKASV